MLRELVDIAKEINTDIYTEQSANAFKEALEEAEAVLANENALQDELDAAHKKLQEAMDGLKVIPVDKITASETCRRFAEICRKTE